MSNVKIVNDDFRNHIIPAGLVITDPPYNQGYAYNQYKDRMSEEDYIKLLSKIPRPCVLIHYPEETINLLPKAFSAKCEQVVCWVYNSNTGKQSRLISWWGCKPDFRKVRQEYKNLNDKRIQKRIAEGKTGAKLYDWWEINQVKNVSKEKTNHPCQIPELLIERIILTTAKPDQLIIDPFGGSGTTAKVAQKHGFDSLSFEIDKEYCDIIQNRINA
ncbi:MAG TPA: site-specific DNA-methyltransferase [Bacteroidales bacterium]|nr:site-specific DNA-methyltransferase [Bacteroidales bacterium]